MEIPEDIDHSDTVTEDEILRRERDRITSAIPVVEEEPKEDDVKPVEKMQEEKKEEPKVLTEKQKERLRKKEKYRNRPKSKSHGQVSFPSYSAGVIRYMVIMNQF